MRSVTLEKCRTDDELQITYTHTPAPRGGGYDILCQYSDGFVPLRSCAVLLVLCHSPMDVSNFMMSRLDDG
jgi:hypothetical protein